MARKYLKPVALFMALNLLGEICFPTMCYALTGGPSQPEMESFEPVGTTDMVDLFSGDFNYNIPLLDVGGYPINIAYHSGIGMDQEASWTGLGWNINAGVINRTMRGLPDDFKGDKITYESNIKEDITWGLTAGAEFEILGLTDKQTEATKGRINERVADDLKKNPNSKIDSSAQIGEGYSTVGINMGISHNNYRGLGVFFGPSFRIPNTTIKVGATASSQGGFNYDLSFTKKLWKEKTGGANIGMGSRSGLRMAINGPSFGKTWGDKDEGFSTSFSTGTGASIPLSPIADLPTLNNSFKTTLQNYNLTIGTSFWGAHQNFRLGGTFSTTTLQDKHIERSGYGYMYAEGIANDENGVQDFSRERDGTFGPDTKNLPLVSSSFDFLSVSGQGTGGMFRAHRRNQGIYYDPTYTNATSNWGTAGVELGFVPASFHLGLNYTPSGGTTTSGVWNKDKGNKLSDFHFRNNTDNPLIENYYFQAGGEKVASDIGYYNGLMGETAARLQMNGQGLSYYADIKASLESDHTGGGAITEYDPVEERQPRAQLISILTAKEAADGLGMMPTLRSYVPGVFSQNPGAYSEINRPVSDKGHHMGEITQTNPDGSRYVYAIPAYNNEQQEVTFNAKGYNIDFYRGLIDYTADADNSMGNDKGHDRFYSREIKPGYAHSYLLTAVLSPNYVDADLNGKPSEGDIGDYVLFNYTRHDAEYRWRVPAEENKAQYQQGLYSDIWDDKGSYVYGTKEIWFLHSIESRTHVAEFKTSPRKDALGVNGPNGGKNNDETTMKLDTIVLYSLPDKQLNGANATPVKKVVFEYDYSLCSNVPNNVNYMNDNAAAGTKGKLTLKKLYFLYGHSGKGAMSPYTFNYGYNPDYNMAEYDRWGNYKPNRESLPNRDFPYVDQSMPKDSADLYASAWNMNEVRLPSGGSIQVHYESDDYAFVQDRQAMQMVKIIGACDSKESIKKFTKDAAGYERLYSEKGDKIYSYLVFEPPAGVSTQEQLEACFKDVKQLYFKFLVKVKDNKEEYISGWCPIVTGKYDKLKGVIFNKPEVGFKGNDPNPELAYVKINSIPQGDLLWNKSDPVNPISKAAWQFATAYMNKVLHPGSEPSSSGVGAFQGLLDSWSEGLDMFRGQYQSLKANGIADRFVKGKSWVRIGCGSMFKYGGGCRVKELTFSDSWANMDQADKTGNYNQVYDYTLNDEVYGTISSGVAAYEPMIGGEENPLRQLVETYEKETNATMPAMELYVEEPFGESFYPGASVGYSKVTVRNKPKTGVNRTGTGYSENRFFTARDYPVKVTRTGLKTASVGTGRAGQFLSSLLKVVTKDYYAASQGYSVVVNDMHGKPKSTGVYSELTDANGKGLVISEVSYTYQKDNMVKVLNRDGSISDAMIGKEIDMAIDLRQNEQVDWNGGLEVNAKFDLAGVIPVAWAIPWPKFSYAMSRRQSASVTKVIQKYGILESTTVKDEGSIITTRNLLYDGLSGNVLLTQTSNMFEDPIYNFNYPAHFAYEGMGAAYENTGITQLITMPNSTTDGITSSVHTPGVFHKGDQLMITDVFNATYPGWVLDVIPVSGGEKPQILNPGGEFHFGAVSETPYRVKIISSGYKNMLSSSVGNLVMSGSPISGNTLSIDNDEVIEAGAQTYSEQWPMHDLSKELDTTYQYCRYEIVNRYNPFVTGNKGLWLPHRTKVFVENRKYSYLADTTFIRKDGSYASFVPYWNFEESDYLSESNDKRWVSANTITRINRRVNPVEAMDALGNYSAELYGYSQNLVTANASYAKIKDIASDNFEDYLSFEGCLNFNDLHWSFRAGRNDTNIMTGTLSLISPSLTSTQSHSGTKSLLIGPQTTGTVTSLIDSMLIMPVGNSISNGYDDVLISNARLPFMPGKSKTYVISSWVMGRDSNRYEVNTYDSCYIRVKMYKNSSVTQNNVFKASGPIIEGWQRIEATITIPSDAEYMNVSIENTGSYNAYLDDIRIHPFESNMKTYVYHPVLLKVMAILDENNFATFYEYDKEGKLIRIKKETVKGIMTIQESRNGIQKPLNP
ncbi:carbohydrate binding domain-containing protein [Pedobacter insulae]|uniref:RHS repeat-associated core domain-containing protein n=1 Tax=Pedobacter insulae TaxID=414048 RepID=A0A1I2ZH61_9SPHI|nr:hypothetical protein [Pedobacter insulae]SFH37158.1 hypothetical protein SAMN04489864_11027 [Pedobacter insulae]